MTPKPTPLGAIATANPDTAASQRSIWADQKTQDQAVNNCLVHGPRQTESQNLCVADLMRANGATLEAVDFFRLNESWLAGFIRGASRMDAGLIQKPGTANLAPQFVFLNGSPQVQLERDLFNQAFLPDASDGTAPFKSDPMFAALLAVAHRKFDNGDDPVDLKLFEVNVLESFSGTAGGGEEFVIESGIHNFSPDASVGVAARYAFDFDAAGKLLTVKLLSLCQGRLVTDNVEGVGRVTFHDFSGIKILPGRTGISEPYLLTVPGLGVCPPHQNF